MPHEAMHKKDWPERMFMVDATWLPALDLLAGIAGPNARALGIFDSSQFPPSTARRLQISLLRLLSL